ncbi:MAG TPA: DUF2238 domain-containing protein [Steroidobacteraceae bacterium]|nr:DUF2238 domain-containing protein [Steroidobacteraceae bacterium]
MDQADAGPPFKYHGRGHSHLERMPIPLSSRVAFLGFMGIAVVGLAISGIDPRDRMSWWLEVLPVVIALPLLGWTHERFPLTWLAYALVAAYTVVLVVGGYYTYARVPLGLWAQDVFHLSRNNYDRLEHFVEGFVPAIVLREILLRRTPLVPGPWLALLVVAACMAASVCYELINWCLALMAGAHADLGAQGDTWNGHWHMLYVTLGAVCALLLLSRVHDRALRSLHNRALRPLQPSV